MSKLRGFEQQTVPQILKILEDRFGRTQLEKIDDILRRMKKDFKVEDKETEQSWWDKFETLTIDCKEIKLQENFNLFLCCWMICCGKEGKILTENDDKVFRKDMKEKEEADVLSIFEKIYREEKIENNRDCKGSSTE